MWRQRMCVTAITVLLHLMSPQPWRAVNRGTEQWLRFEIHSAQNRSRSVLCPARVSARD
jgi:hypothetical protein